MLFEIPELSQRVPREKIWKAPSTKCKTCDTHRANTWLCMPMDKNSPTNNLCLNKNVYERAIPREKSQLKYLGHILGKPVLNAPLGPCCCRTGWGHLAQSAGTLGHWKGTCRAGRLWRGIQKPVCAHPIISRTKPEFHFVNLSNKKINRKKFR